jgi:hypothetical protein
MIVIGFILITGLSLIVPITGQFSLIIGILIGLLIGILIIFI